MITNATHTTNIKSGLTDKHDDKHVPIAIDVHVAKTESPKDKFVRETISKIMDLYSAAITNAISSGVNVAAAIIIVVASEVVLPVIIISIIVIAIRILWRIIGVSCIICHFSVP